MGDNNIKEPAQAVPSVQSSSWRSNIDPRSRQKIIWNMLEMMKKSCNRPEKLSQFEKLARKVEDKVFAEALDQQDYMKTISLKMAQLKRSIQTGVANSSVKHTEKSVTPETLPVLQHKSFQDVPDQRNHTILQQKAVVQQSSSINRQNQSPLERHPGSSQKPQQHFVLSNRVSMEDANPSPCPSSKSNNLLRPVVGRREPLVGSLEAHKGSEVSSYAEKHGVLVQEAWRENTYKRIMAMKSRYMSRLRQIHYMINTKLKQHEVSNSCQFEKMKEANNMLERIMRLLNIPKEKLVPGHEQNLDAWEKRIVNYLSMFFKSKTTTSSLQHGSDPCHESVQPSEQHQLVSPIDNHRKDSDNSECCHNDVNNVVGSSEIISDKTNACLTPIQRLVNSVSSISQNAMKSSVDDICSVMTMVDGMRSSSSGTGSRSAVGQDLAMTTLCRIQARRFRLQDGNLSSRLRKSCFNSVPTEMQNGVDKSIDEYATKSHRKRLRLDEDGVDKLREEIKDVNQRLIDTQVNICEEDINVTSPGTVVKCCFNGMSVKPRFGCFGYVATVKPLLLLVPIEYPKRSPILLEKFPCEVGDEFFDLSNKARSKLESFLRSFKDSVTLTEIAQTWETCAHAVVTEYADQHEGGTFSSRYGTWEKCLGAV